MNFDLGEILTRMWKIGWNHKTLWLWQMLPGVLMAVIMPVFILANPGFLMLLPEPFNQYGDEPWIMIAFVGMTFLLVIPSMFLQVLVQLATTCGAVKVERGAEKIAFMELFRESLPYFWRVFGLYAIFAGGWMVIWVGFMAVFMAGSMLTMGLAALCFMPLFFLVVPVFLVGYSILELAQAAIVADDMPLMDAIAHGWALFRANVLGVVVLMLILYFGLSTLSSLFVFPMMFPMMLLPLGLNSQGNPGNMMFVFFLVFFPLMVVVIYAVQGILMAFFRAAWAALYLRLSRSTPMMAEGQ
ncbi:MAG: hypothetical protein DPW18_14750 [Chloroflexi bacterium]|nr:hypothetical protein [Chloroflexota bacterium]MDL1942109.1 hypothetical protein [Chloroflexi bacterium CFX2]